MGRVHRALEYDVLNLHNTQATLWVGILVELGKHCNANCWVRGEGRSAHIWRLLPPQPSRRWTLALGWFSPWPLPGGGRIMRSVGTKTICGNYAVIWKAMRLRNFRRKIEIKKIWQGPFFGIEKSKNKFFFIYKGWIMNILLYLSNISGGKERKKKTDRLKNWYFVLWRKNIYFIISFTITCQIIWSLKSNTVEHHIDFGVITKKMLLRINELLLFVFLFCGGIWTAKISGTGKICVWFCTKKGGKHVEVVRENNGNMQKCGEMRLGRNMQRNVRECGPHKSPLCPNPNPNRGPRSKLNIFCLIETQNPTPKKTPSHQTDDSLPLWRQFWFITAHQLSTITKPNSRNLPFGGGVIGRGRFTSSSATGGEGDGAQGPGVVATSLPAKAQDGKKKCKRMNGGTYNGFVGQQNRVLEPRVLRVKFYNALECCFAMWCFVFLCTKDY